MIFEYDPAKSASNRTMHGIDFIEAQRLWSDDRLLTLPARDEIEVRFLAIGMIGELCWAAVYTIRDGAVRFISVRRGRREEGALYDRQ